MRCVWLAAWSPGCNCIDVADLWNNRQIGGLFGACTGWPGNHLTLSVHPPPRVNVQNSTLASHLSRLVDQKNWQTFCRQAVSEVIGMITSFANGILYFVCLFYCIDSVQFRLLRHLSNCWRGQSFRAAVVCQSVDSLDCTQPTDFTGLEYLESMVCDKQII